MRYVLVLAACVVSVVASPATATLLYYDPFLTGANPAAGQYAVGLLDTTLDAPTTGGQSPTIGPTTFLQPQWDAVFSGPNGKVQESGLSFLGAPALGGSQISTADDPLVTNSDVRARRALTTPWTDTTIGIFYISLLANFGSTEGAVNTDMGFRAFELYSNPNTILYSVGYRAYDLGGGVAQTLPATARMFLGGSTYQILDGGPDNFNEDGANHLIVMRFSLSSDPGADSVSVYLDPKSVDEPVVASATVTGANILMTHVGGMTIYGGSGTSPVMDELRVATTFAEAVPDFPAPGDTDNDDDVDFVDYQNIIKYMNLGGAAVPNTIVLHPDITGDGKVTIADYRLWKDRRTDLTPGSGSGAGSAGISAPEPTSMLLALISTWAIAHPQGRRR